jgi:hypothetical protein
MAKNLKEDKKLIQRYERIVSSYPPKEGVIICPECKQELLITPIVSGMNQVIENHLGIHKTIYQDCSSLEVTKLIRIRLSLMWQVLHRRGIID